MCWPLPRVLLIDLGHSSMKTLRCTKNALWIMSKHMTYNYPHTSQVLLSMKTATVDRSAKTNCKNGFFKEAVKWDIQVAFELSQVFRTHGLKFSKNWALFPHTQEFVPPSGQPVLFTAAPRQLPAHWGIRNVCAMVALAIERTVKEMVVSFILSIIISCWHNWRWGGIVPEEKFKG